MNGDQDLEDSMFPYVYPLAHKEVKKAYGESKGPFPERNLDSLFLNPQPFYKAQVDLEAAESTKSKILSYIGNKKASGQEKLENEFILPPHFSASNKRQKKDFLRLKF